jgi:nicotinamidase-related amidase
MRLRKPPTLCALFSGSGQLRAKRYTVISYSSGINAETQGEIMSQPKLHFFIVDPQNDFCDLPVNYCPAGPRGDRFTPALAVAGAHLDMQRLAALIDAVRSSITAITVTLDSHQRLDIAHPTFWRDAAGAPPAPYTRITAADLRAGRYLPRDAQATGRAQAYLDALEASGGHMHTIWPVHCEIGTPGHNIHYDLHQALRRWEEEKTAAAVKVCKGQNPWTEHYSVFMAEVPDPGDPATSFNDALLASLRQADGVYIAGEAGSHCVRASARHIVDNWPIAELKRITLIEDCISPVGGFEAGYTDFLNTMRELGVRVMRAGEVRAELLDNVR